MCANSDQWLNKAQETGPTHFGKFVKALRRDIEATAAFVAVAIALAELATLRINAANSERPTADQAAA